MDREEMITEILQYRSQLRRRDRHHSHREGDTGSGRILGYLARHDGTAGPTELCRFMDVTTPRITVLLNELEEQELITRQIDPKDRRKICVTLTRKGAEKVARREQARREELSVLLDKLTPEDQQAMLRIYRAMLEM